MTTPAETYRNILVATDGSEGSRRAIGRAIALATAAGAQLTVISVAGRPNFPVLMPEMGAIVTPDVGEMVTEVREEAEKAADEAIARAKAAGLDPGRQVIEGDVRSSITSAAASLGADLIVVGSHGWSRLERLLLGSTADYLAQHAPCSVLVVRPTSA